MTAPPREQRCVSCTMLAAAKLAAALRGDTEGAARIGKTLESHRMCCRSSLPEAEDRPPAV